MKHTNLTAPRFRPSIEVNSMDGRFVRMGIIAISPGQWLTVDGRPARYVRHSASGGLWLVHAGPDRKVSSRKFRQACKAWLKS